MEFSDEELLKKTTEEIKSIFGKAFNEQFSTTTYRFNTGAVYRGRPNWDGKLKKEVELFLHTDELWAPPPGDYLSQGRCNGKGQSLFYCTNNSSAILWELDCQPGNKLTIGLFENKEDFYPLGIIGAKKIAEIDNSHRDIFGNHYKNITSNGQRLHDMVEKFFTSKGSQYYNVTNAITSIFLHDNTSVPLPSVMTTPESMMGVIYSSVAAQLNVYNIALQPEHSKQALKPVEYHKIVVEERPSPNHFVITYTHASREIKPDGTIEWEKLKSPKTEGITDITL